MLSRPERVPLDYAGADVPRPGERNVGKRALICVTAGVSIPLMLFASHHYGLLPFPIAMALESLMAPLLLFSVAATAFGTLSGIVASCRHKTRSAYSIIAACIGVIICAGALWVLWELAHAWDGVQG